VSSGNNSYKRNANDFQFSSVARGKYGVSRRYGNDNPLKSNPADYRPLSRMLTTPSRRRMLLASAAERRECTAVRSLYLS